VCTVVKEQFLPKRFLPYLPDTSFVMCSYAVSPSRPPNKISAEMSIALVPAQASQARIETVSRFGRSHL
jgi:hypothetical protein